MVKVHQNENVVNIIHQSYCEQRHDAHALNLISLQSVMQSHKIWLLPNMYLKLPSIEMKKPTKERN